MLHLDSISVILGDRRLLDGVSAMINPGERIGLVGPNGAGKSTLLKIINGSNEPDQGRVNLANHRRIGYLPQDGVDPNPSFSVYQEIESAYAEIIEAKRQVDGLLERLETIPVDDPSMQTLMDRYGTLQHQLEASGFYTMRAEIEKVMAGLGFSPTDMERPTTEFSGGWLMRMALAKLLLRRPDVLLLDEPTNHLDIESQQWIEEFLIGYQGAIILVSHDQAFLDSVTNRTLALLRGRMEDYAGNYSFYRRKYEEQRELLVRAQENQAQEIKETERFIERFRYKATKARQVQSRIKMLDKVERIEVEDELAGVSFRFPPPVRAGQKVLWLERAVKAYGVHRIFDGLDLEIERGDKIAVVGPNGAGKSTLIRMLAGVEPLTDGRRVVGHNATPSYFAQHQAEELNPDNDLLDEMRLTGSRESETTMRSILGCFLFSGDDVFKKVKVLSGGEKSRVALAKMLLTPANVLIFDEPTNHLDMQSKHILQQALVQYEGTLIIVSHDRSFLDPVVNKTLEIQPKVATFFLGDVSYYLHRKKEQAAAAAKGGSAKGGMVGTAAKAGTTAPGKTGRYSISAIGSTASDSLGGAGRKGTHTGAAAAQSAASTPGAAGSAPSTLDRKELKRLEAERRNERSKRLKPLQTRLQSVEKEIENLEQRRRDIEITMGTSELYEDPELVKAMSLEFDELGRKLNEALSKWEELSWRIEGIEQQFSA